MTIQRTAGPLGKTLGFAGTIGKLRFAFNAGWYALVLNWRGSWYIQLSCDPWMVDWYRTGTDGGYWPKRESSHAR